MFQAKDNEGDDWLSHMKRMQGTGVSYYSAPQGAMAYNASALTR
jgi:hypothetical protein